MDKKHPWPQRNVVWEDRGKITVLLSAVKQFFCVMSFDSVLHILLTLVNLLNRNNINSLNASLV